MSSANNVCPVHLERASTFRKGLPMTFRGAPFFPLPLLITVDALFGGFRRFTAHPGRGQFHGLEDLEIAGAAAQIARKRLLDLLAIGTAIVFEQLFGDQQESGRAIPALCGAEIGEGLLQWM